MNEDAPLVGGAFTTLNNFNSPHLVRLNQNGTVDTNFDLNFSVNGSVRAIVIQNDGKVVIGGDFNSVNGASSPHLARLNLDGSWDASFTTNLLGGFDGSVLTLALQADNRIVVGGDFTQGNGVTRHRITRLLPDGKVDPTINFGDGANAAVNAAVVQPADGLIVIGGSFTRYDGVIHQRIANPEIQIQIIQRQILLIRDVQFIDGEFPPDHERHLGEFHGEGVDVHAEELPGVDVDEDRLLTGELDA